MLTYDQLSDIIAADNALLFRDRAAWHARYRAARNGDFSQYSEAEREAWEIVEGIKPPPRHPNDEITDWDLRGIFFVELPESDYRPFDARNAKRWMDAGRKWMAMRLAEYAVYLQKEEDADKWTMQRITSQPYASDIFRAVRHYHFAQVAKMPPELVERELIQTYPGKIEPRFACNRGLKGAKVDPNEKVWENVARDVQFHQECEIEQMRTDMTDAEPEQGAEKTAETPAVAVANNEDPVVPSVPTERPAPPPDPVCERMEPPEPSAPSAAASRTEDLSWLC